MKRQDCAVIILWLLGIVVPTASAGAAEQIYFEDIATDITSGFDYQRTRSARDAEYELLRQMDLIEGIPVFPVKSRGVPGVAILDYDRDGDLDIYVTNGPGTANSLYTNQLMETGTMTFVDDGVAAGVAAVNQDSSGVCFGDVDNDGYHDLYVMGSVGPNILYHNNGDGTFTDITAHAGVGGGNMHTSGASMGDVNGDGLLDIYVGNFGNFDNSEILNVEPFGLNQHNQLFLNLGANRFEDVSQSSGITVLAGLTPSFGGEAGATHAVAMVDYDMDGDIDILNADDQAAIPPASIGGVNRGLIHLFQNDGTGKFTDVNMTSGVGHAGAWMGFSFGDYNRDGHLDFFAANFGMYSPFNMGDPVNIEQNPSRWYLSAGDGTFIRPGLDNVGPTPFGWGTSGFDYDNDADTDIVFYGNMDAIGFINLSNPGVILRNDGNAAFDWDAEALAQSSDHLRRNVNGLAVGDLNRDGFMDIVSVSNFDIPESLPLETWHDQGGVFDGIAKYIPTIFSTGSPPAFQYNPTLPDFPDGTLSVEMNSADNGNGFVSFRLQGARGLTPHGKVNRDGIGAVLTFKPYAGSVSMQPIVGGASYASQDSIEAHFGLGRARSGVLDVLWPGGIKTRLYGVKAGERLIIPELPFSYDDPSIDYRDYVACTRHALDALVDTGALSANHAFRILESAKMARLFALHTPF